MPMLARRLQGSAGTAAVDHRPARYRLAVTARIERAAAMRGVVLPGGRQVDWVDQSVPEPGERQVLVRMRASSICGSDIRAIYREHLGQGAEAYQDVIAGHEPAGEVVEVGPGCRVIRPGDRVAVYHIAGCGMCDECRRGYMIGCDDPSRAAYGWQRDGGHATFLLAEEVTCIPLPDELSFVDGASAACSGGTAYEALLRVRASGRDRLLVTGLGPVGLAVALLARGFGVGEVFGVDLSPERRALAKRLGLVAESWAPDEALGAVLDRSHGGVEVSVDASGSGAARRLGVEALRDWGRGAWIGEGGSVELAVSPLVIHKQATIHGSWVTSLGHMAELLDRLVRWDLRLESLVTDRFPLSDAAEAYAAADGGAGGKVCLVLD
jgi:threonine dehydrogenase-like Zn-dependent dehydrogenase